MRYGSLERYIPWQSVGLPVNWEDTFSQSGPLKVEIGFGNGGYLVRCAQEEPQVRYLGLEITWGSVWRVLRAAHRHKLDNLRVLLGDANETVRWAFAEKSVDDFTGLFPCPWPKKRHAKYRLYQPPFIKLCNSRLKDGCSLTVVTDHAPYRDQMMEENDPADTGMELSLETIPASFGTKYERKWQEGGQQEFYRLTYRKVRHIPIPQPETINVNPHLVQGFDPETFSPKDEHEPFNIAFKSFLFDPARQTAMQEVFATEDSVSQHFWVRIKKQDKGWKIAPAAGGNLLPVPSVQRSLDLMKEAAGG